MGQPGDNHDDMLPGVRDEIRRIHCLGNFINVVIGDQANRLNVMSQLKQHNWIHFACHAIQEDQPFHSYFQLCDGEHLTLLDLAAAQLPNTEFAFLSACQTAIGDVLDTSDEVITLVAAVQVCGFQSVVGTLWGMSDTIVATVAEEFYQYMFRTTEMADFKDSAKALHLVTQKMIKSKNFPLKQCVNLVHFGI